MRTTVRTGTALKAHHAARAVARSAWWLLASGCSVQADFGAVRVASGAADSSGSVLLSSGPGALASGIVLLSLGPAAGAVGVLPRHGEAQGLFWWSVWGGKPIECLI